MKLIIKSLISSILVLLNVNIYAQDVIRITNGEWEPYLSEYSYEYGLASHIITEAFKIEGIKVEYGFFPWKRSLEMARNGKWDATAVWRPTEERLTNFLASDTVLTTSVVFFHLTDYNFDWKNFKDLKNINIGVTNGYNYGEAFSNALKSGELKVFTSPTDEHSLDLLLLKRIDLFPNDLIVGNAQIRNYLTPEQAKFLTYHPKQFKQDTLNLLFSKKSPNRDFFLLKFNSGLKKLKESGKLDEMLMDQREGKYKKQTIRWISD